MEKEERLLATALAPYVAEALRAGWVLDTVPNPNAHLDMTLAEYQVCGSVRLCIRCASVRLCRNS